MISSLFLNSVKWQPSKTHCLFEIWLHNVWYLHWVPHLNISRVTRLSPARPFLEPGNFESCTLLGWSLFVAFNFFIDCQNIYFQTHEPNFLIWFFWMPLHVKAEVRKLASAWCWNLCWISWVDQGSQSKTIGYKFHRLLLDEIIDTFLTNMANVYYIKFHWSPIILCGFAWYRLTTAWIHHRMVNMIINRWHVSQWLVGSTSLISFNMIQSNTQTWLRGTCSSAGYWQHILPQKW